LDHNAQVTCALCGGRKARRSCPAAGAEICTLCCGTKRLAELRCPSQCPYLASAREHPPARALRQQQRDVERLLRFLRDFSERQSEVFFLVNSFIANYEPPELEGIADEHVAEAAVALAFALETSVRGVIYQPRPASLAAERLISGLKPLLSKAGGAKGGSAFERDAAVVLRRVHESVQSMQSEEPGQRRAYLELLERILRSGSRAKPIGAPEEPQRLIVP
jgi:hypothetical protein